MACGLADKRRVSPHPGLVRLAQAAKVFDLVRVETGKTNCGTFFSGSWAWGLQSKTFLEKKRKKKKRWVGAFLGPVLYKYVAFGLFFFRHPLIPGRQELAH
jgi:hypothetical protein